MLRYVFQRYRRQVTLAALATLLTTVWLMNDSTFAASTPAPNVLLFYADDNDSASFLRDELLDTGLYSASDMDLLRMPTIPPSLDSLLNYDCILVWTNSAAAAQGDRLKEYVQAGGGVVLSTYARSPTFSPWDLEGGIMEDGFNPLDLTDTRLYEFPRSLNFETMSMDHPVLENVSDFSYGGNDNYAAVSLDPGAILIGTDNYSVPLMAISDSGRVVGINLYPGPTFPKTPGVFRTFANACMAVIATHEDTTPPDVTAALLPAGKVDFKIEAGKLKINGPDPQALLDQLETFGGLVVTNGQLVELKLTDDDEKKYKFQTKKGGKLEIKGQSFALRVLYEDSSGNVATATATPVFAEDDDSDDKEED